MSSVRVSLSEKWKDNNLKESIDFRSLKTIIALDTLSLEEHNDIQSNYPIVSPNYQIDVDQQHADDISRYRPVSVL